MSLASHPSPPKRPRLSLQIKTPSGPQLGKSVTALKADVDPSSPTAFNTLSNAYAAAIEAASPNTPKAVQIASQPTTQPAALRPTAQKPRGLRLETRAMSRDSYVDPSQRTQTPGAFSVAYPTTPSSANRTPTTAHPNPKTSTAAACDFTPPQSAGSHEPSSLRIFTFAAEPDATMMASPSSPRTPRRRAATVGGSHLPYTHPRALHSILRNSPLPPRSTITPLTPTRMSLRIARAAAGKRVGYNDPLTQTITTNKYVKSHIELLAEDSPGPFSATEVGFGVEEMPDAGVDAGLDRAMESVEDASTRDGGQTPGPFEEMNRRMAESYLETPASRRRKRKEKKRKWRWTIGEAAEDEMDVDEGAPAASEAERQARRARKRSDALDEIMSMQQAAAAATATTPLTAIRIDETPITAIRRGVSVSTDGESEASEADEDEDRPGSSSSI